MTSEERNHERIMELKEELLDLFNISTDRDLINQLGISDEDKRKLFLWISYQCAFAYREGFDNGQDELKIEIKEKFNNLLELKREF